MSHLSQRRGVCVAIGIVIGLAAGPFLSGEGLAQQTPQLCHSSDCCRSAEGAELHGRVVTAESGEPLPGATVEFRIAAPADGGGPATAVTETDATGAYRLCGIETPTRVEAQAEHSGATSRSVSFRLEDTGRVEVSFEIRGVPAGLDSLQEVAAASAQRSEPGRIVGRIVDAETGRPVAEATVTLTGSEGQALTDREGRFEIAEASPGKGTLAIHHVAYGDRSVEVEVPSDLTVNLDIELPPKAIEVEPIDVRVEATVRDPYLERRGYYERKAWAEKLGMGEFLEVPDIQMRGAEVSHVLSTMPGLRTLNGQLDGFVHFTRYSTSFHGGPCLPAVYLDGTKLVGSTATRGVPGTRIPSGAKWGRYASRLGGSRGLTTLLSPVSVAAIEVYKGPASTAGEFLGSDSRCGVIVLWTKHGPDVNVGGRR